MNNTNFDLEKDALIVIDPNGKKIQREEKQQERHKNLFEKNENESDEEKQIGKIVKKCIIGFQFGSKLSGEGYIVLFGKTASPKADNPIGYFQKLLYIPKSLNNKPSDQLKQLLKCFEDASKDLIKKGLSLEIRISGAREMICISNEDLANDSFNTEKILDEIKEIQKQLEKSQTGDSR